MTNKKDAAKTIIDPVLDIYVSQRTLDNEGRIQGWPGNCYNYKDSH